MRGVLLVNDQSLSEPDVVNLVAMAPEATSSSGAERFERLFGHFYPELFGLVYRVLGERMETEDTLQDVFLKLSDAGRAPGTARSRSRRLAAPGRPQRGLQPAADGQTRARLGWNALADSSAATKSPSKTSWPAHQAWSCARKSAPPCGAPWPKSPSGSANACSFAIRAIRTPKSRRRSASPSARSACCSSRAEHVFSTTYRRQTQS